VGAEVGRELAGLGQEIVNTLLAAVQAPAEGGQAVALRPRVDDLLPTFGVGAAAREGLARHAGRLPRADGRATTFRRHVRLKQRFHLAKVSP
jgi:hypothetical protein